jgi:hypothetical protein
MEDLKSIETQDPDEKSCLEFLTMDKSSWQINEQKDDYKLSYQYIQMMNPLKKTPEEKLSFCLEVTLKKPVDKVIKYLNDINIRKTFDTLYKEGKILSETKGNPDIYQLYFMLKMGFVFSNRDFVVQKKIWKDYNNKKDNYLIHVISIDHKEYPEQSDPVRGIFLNRAAFIKPGEKEGETSLTLCNCIEMNIINVGSFMAISKGSSGMKNWLNNLIEALEKE